MVADKIRAAVQSDLEKIVGEPYKLDSEKALDWVLLNYKAPSGQLWRHTETDDAVCRALEGRTWSLS